MSSMPNSRKSTTRSEMVGRSAFIGLAACGGGAGCITLKLDDKPLPFGGEVGMGAPNPATRWWIAPTPIPSREGEECTQLKRDDMSLAGAR